MAIKTKMSRKKNLNLRKRFTKDPSENFKQINVSIEFDKFLFREDIEASIAHAEMLEMQNIIKISELKKISSGLKKILKEIEIGSFKFDEKHEDIHMNIENRLEELIGDIAGKLHTARSRNDQVITDLKLWMKKDIDAIINKIKLLKKSLVSKAEKNLNIMMPGLTHFQTAQPISSAHHFMAYYEMFSRDEERLLQTKERMNLNPLGACALAGTSFNINRHQTSKRLGFKGPTRNSLDTVSDRDFVMDFIYSASVTSIHLSRIAEEIILWSSDLINFSKLGDEVMSSSSIMPQKRNPDAMELVRAKSSILISNLNAMQNIMKALPLSYSKDLQEDKKLITETSGIIKSCLDCMVEAIESMQLNKNELLNSIKFSYSNATELADWLVQNLNYSFRKSHGLTSKIVNYAEDKKCYLNDLSLEEFKLFDKRITKSVYNSLDTISAINSKKSFGGTSLSEIKKMIKVAKKNNE